MRSQLSLRGAATD